MRTGHRCFAKLSFTFAVLLTAGCGTGKANARDQVEALKSAIPLQSTPDRVISYLDRKKIEHSSYSSGKSGGTIRAIIHHSSKWDVVYADYGVAFNFDKSDRLTAIEIQEHLTGP